MASATSPSFSSVAALKFGIVAPVLRVHELAVDEHPRLGLHGERGGGFDPVVSGDLFPPTAPATPRRKSMTSLPPETTGDRGAGRPASVISVIPADEDAASLQKEDERPAPARAASRPRRSLPAESAPNRASDGVLLGQRGIGRAREDRIDAYARSGTARLLRHVGADGQLAPHVIGLAVLLDRGVAASKSSIFRNSWSSGRFAYQPPGGGRDEPDGRALRKHARCEHRSIM